jgi:uncharacterized protein (DUF1778 family)
MATVAKVVKNATTIRFDEYTRQVIDKAAELSHQTRTAFLLSSARERAEKVIKERTKTMEEMGVLLLSPQASLDLASNLEKPPAINKKLKNAMADYHAFTKRKR